MATNLPEAVRKSAEFWGARVKLHIERAINARGEQAAAAAINLAVGTATYAATAAGQLMSEHDYCERCGGLVGIAAYASAKLDDICDCEPKSDGCGEAWEGGFAANH